MRYILVPEPFRIYDAITEEAVPDTEAFSFAKFVRVLTSNASQPAQMGAPTPDTLTLVDIRAEAAKQSAGATWAISDEWYEILKKEAKCVRGGSPAFIFSAEPHVRAILNAPDKLSAAAS